MFIRNPQKDVSLEEERAVVSRRLSRRWKLLQILGAALIALAGVIDWLHFSDPTVPDAPMLFLMAGIMVFITGLAMQRGGTAGLTEK
jgi:drug/metabolite transporter (DMT)-like permease